jgi:hypothetical protein
MYYKDFNQISNLQPKNDLERYFLENKNGPGIHKWFHYFEIYDRYFSKYRDKEISILEIGVENGGSLRMWRNYFGNKAKIYGIDINPNCKKFEDEGIEIFIGSQEDVDFWDKVKQKIPKLDILIDDGGHTMIQQIITYEQIFSHLKEDSIYLCEDLHTSYWPEFYSGGLKKENTFIEYSKNFIDYINAWHSRELEVNFETKNIFGVHFYDSILVLEKREILPPFHSDSGILTQTR